MTQFAGRILLAASAIVCCAWFASATAAEDFGETLTKRLGVHAVNLDVDGHRAFVLMPPTEKQQTPQPWIMYAPTLPGFPDEHEAWMHRKFVDAGIAVAGIDAGEAYGSPQGSEAMSTLYEQLVERRDFAKRPCLLGRSRGGLWVTSWAAANPEKVAGIAGIYPVFDLQTYPGLEKAAPAYGVTVAELTNKLDKVNPINRLQPLIDARVPIYIIHGDVDEVVPLEPNSAAVSAQYKASRAGDSVTLNVVEGQGHNYYKGFFRDPELVKFAIKCARDGAEPNKGPTLVAVSGIVTIDGVPLKKGSVMIAPIGQRPAMGVIDNQGRFMMSTFQKGDGVAPGTHRVSVTACEPITAQSNRWNAPKKYANPETSGLQVTIEDSRDNLEIKLTWEGGKPFVEDFKRARDERKR